MKFLNKIKRIQVHRENSLNQPTDLAEEANIIHHHLAADEQKEERLMPDASAKSL